MPLNLPEAKRRRINDASVLSKPFKSPLKRNHSTADSNASQNQSPTTSHLTHKPALNTPSQNSAHAQPLSPPSSASNGAFAHPSRPTATPASFARRARILRSDIDTLEQATRLRTPDAQTQKLEDEHLRALIAKWRNIAQAAAEEVYGVTKEQVDGAGGIKAWREREREEKRDEEKRDEAGERNKEDGEGACRDKEEIAVRDSDALRTMEEDEEDGFTMTTMLRILRIDSKVVGWDGANERWDE